MRSHPIILTLACLTVGLFSLRADDSTPVVVHVDTSKNFQTIDGFGVFGGFNKSWNQVMSPELASTLVDDLGITISRTELRPEFEPKDLSLDGSDQDLSKYGGKSPGVAQYINVCKTLHDKGVNKFLLTVWTPPPWMKNPGNHGHTQVWCSNGSAGGYLLPENYEKFANYLVMYLKYFKQEVGVEAYALSPQNELAFDEPYNSCVYNPDQYAKLIAVIGKKFAEAGVTTKILFPEDIGVQQRVMSFITGVLDNSESSQYAGIVAIHAYDTSGTKPDSPSAKTWGDIYETASKHQLPFWMTETSGYKPDLGGAIGLAQAMYVGLKLGHVGAWIFWQASEGGEPGDPPKNESLTTGADGKNAPPKYFAAKQYFHYVRPGAVSVDTNCSDDTILPLSFRNDTDGNLTFVIINKGTVDKQITLDVSGKAPASYASYRTSETEQCADSGTVNAGDAIKLPARSITTFQGKY